MDTKEPKLEFEAETGWNVMEAHPFKDDLIMQPKTDLHLVKFVFSESPLGALEGTKIDDVGDGSSLIMIDLGSFTAEFNGEVDHPHGFNAFVNTERGQLKIDFEVNKEGYLCGFSTSLSATSFDEGVSFVSHIFTGILNNLVSKYKTPTYIKRIIIKNDVGGLKAWSLFGVRSVKWDGILPFAALNPLKQHALALMKEIVSTYHLPAYNIASHHKMYELFNQIDRRAEKEKVIEISKNSKAILSHTISPKDINLEIFGMTYEKAFEYIGKNFRDIVQHGKLISPTFGNYDNPDLFFKSLRYLPAIRFATDEMFKFIMELPKGFVLDYKKR